MRILITGKQAAFRNALKRFLQSRSEFEVLGTAAGKADLLRLVEADTPDLLLLDENLAKNLVQEVFVPLRELDPQPSMIVLGSKLELKQVYLDAGAEAFIDKSTPPKNLLTTIETLRLRGSSA